MSSQRHSFISMFIFGGKETLLGFSVFLSRECLTVGNIIQDIVIGEGDCNSAEAGLQSAVSKFQSTLAHFTSGVVFETRDLVKGGPAL
jgi:hypothetical protein